MDANLRIITLISFAFGNRSPRKRGPYVISEYLPQSRNLGPRREHSHLIRGNQIGNVWAIATAKSGLGNSGKATVTLKKRTPAGCLCFSSFIFLHNKRSTRLLLLSAASLPQKSWIPATSLVLSPVTETTWAVPHLRYS